MHAVARRKGKSRRRIKDWQRRFRQEDLSSLDADQSETLQPQRVKLPPWRLREAMGQVAVPDGPQTEGMVVGMFPGGAAVRVEGEELLCRIAGTFKPPRGASALAVGDQVTVALTRTEHVSGDSDADKDRADGAIVARQPRETALSRPQSIGGRRRGLYTDDVFEKVIAANMETLLIVVSVRKPALRPGLIDRFCIIAERGEMESVVVINKVDLGAPDPGTMSELTDGGSTPWSPRRTCPPGRFAPRTSEAGTPPPRPPSTSCPAAGSSSTPPACESWPWRWTRPSFPGTSRR